MTLLPILPPDKDGNPIPDSHTLFGGVNTTEERIVEHVTANIRRQLPQVKQYQLQNTKIIFAAGGPSLKTNLKKLRRQYNQGNKFALVTVNGTHDFMLDQGFIPKMHIMVDARPWNARFVQRPAKTCRYLLASQCHPSIFEALEGYDVSIYHTSGHEDAASKVLEKYYFGKYIKVVGGSTVTLNSFMLLRTLGFRYFDVYGFDSCLLNNKHHSYDQSENDRDSVIPVYLREGDEDRKFMCTSWMVRQAYDFRNLVRAIRPDLFKCRVHGNGLIAGMMKAGYEIELTKGE